MQNHRVWAQAHKLKHNKPQAHKLKHNKAQAHKLKIGYSRFCASNQLITNVDHIVQILRF